MNDLEIIGILKQNKEFKNYRELCKKLNWKITSGDCKKAQFKELSRYCKWGKDGYKIKIKKVFENPIPKLSKKKKYKRKYGKNLKIPRDKWDNIGVYIIIDRDRNCYIGSTIAGFYKRYVQHWKGKNPVMKHTYDLLHKSSSKFKILEDMTGKSEQEIREKENYYIQLYKNDDKYTLINHYEFVNIPKPKKEKMKTIKIKVKESEYDSTLEKLKELHLID